MGKGPNRPNDSTDASSDEESSSETDQTDVRDYDSSDSRDNPEGSDESDKDEAEQVGSGGSGAVSVPHSADLDSEDDSSDSEEDDSSEDSHDDLRAGIIVYTDPWDTVGWENEPELRYIEEAFGDNVSISYRLLPPRSVHMDQLENDNKMPIADNVTIPESTALSNRALAASREQDLFQDYLRRLQIAALSEGRNIEDRTYLLNIASEVGLNTEDLEEDMRNVTVEESKQANEAPRIEATIAGTPHQWTGQIEGERIFARIIGEGVREEAANSSLEEFVSQHRWVTEHEVAMAFEMTGNQAVDDLSRNDRIESITIGTGVFWKT